MFTQLDLFYREVQAPGALVAYIYFADTDPIASLVEKTLREEAGSLIDTLPVAFDCTRYDATGDLGHVLLHVADAVSAAVA